jgi:hypothetical protein
LLGGVPDAADLPFPLRTLTVGLRPVSMEGWLEPATAEELAAKCADLDLHAAHSIAWLPGSEAAQAELAAVVGAAEPTITAAARAVADDLVLLDGDDLRVIAGAVVHPTRWRLADKLGQTPYGVHAVVPGYAEHLGDATERVLHALRPNRPLERRNWAVLDDPTLHQPVATAGMPKAFDADALWLRVERQVLLRLPETRAIVFGIRTRQWPLGVLRDHPEQAEGLAEALRTTPDDLAAYKGLLRIRGPLLAWLERECQVRTA